MALKAKVLDISSLPEAIRALYRQEDDFFVLDVETVDGFALEDVSGLKSAMQKQRTQINMLKDSMKAFEIDGVMMDPAAAQSAMAKVKELGNLSPTELAEQRVKSALEQAGAQFKKQLETKDAEISGLTGHLSSVMIDQAATAALAAKGGNIKLLLPHVKQQVKLVKDDKGYHTQVIDGDGNARIHVASGRTSDMTLEQLIDEMSASTDFAAAFNATAKPGGGSEGNRRPNGNGSPRVIRASDQAAVNGSIVDIAAGKTQVELQ